MASTSLSRTQTGTITNNKIATFSFWIKRSGISSYQDPMSAVSGGDYAQIQFTNTDNLSIYQRDTTTTMQVVTSRVFRDVGAWYHIVVALDTTQATASDRVKIYVNGVQETSFGTSTYPAQNLVLRLNTASHAQSVGAYSTSSNYVDGSMTHFHQIDGTAYAASTFGETDSTTGIWEPKASPSVTYGNNGFFLKFENSGSMGTDSSGNANNFTVNGTLTQTVDSPGNNFATLNPLYPYTSTGAFTNGNTAPSDYNAVQGIVGTLGVSTGKWYYEVKINGNAPSEIGMVGWGARDNGAINFSGGEAYDYCRYNFTTSYYNNGSATAISGASAYSAGDICGCAIDLDNNYIYWYKNGVLENSGGTAITASSTAGNYFPLVRNGNGNNIQCNFGNGYFGTTAVASAGTSSTGDNSIWEYDCPSGYYGLNTKNINTYG